MHGAEAAGGAVADHVLGSLRERPPALEDARARGGARARSPARPPSGPARARAPLLPGRANRQASSRRAYDRGRERQSDAPNLGCTKGESPPAISRPRAATLDDALARVSAGRAWAPPPSARAPAGSPPEPASLRPLAREPPRPLARAD